jgi:para-nitrobenzyl esterase
LYLNVWTAAKAGDKRPVMVWFHGGGWNNGSGASYTPDGGPLAKKGVVIVTINYRLGALGFLAHPELTAESPDHSSGNYGFLDQIAALKWVQKNIAGFGGDPNRVTIFGESAGSWSVSVLVASPLAKGLFQRAIGESGGRFRPQPHLTEDRNGVMSAEKAGAAFAKAVGMESIKALRAVGAEKLLETPGFRTQETVDGWVLPDEVRAIFAQRKQNDVPVIVGTTGTERTSLTSAATLPKTLADYRKRVESEYGDLIKEFDAAYAVHSEADIADALQSVSGHSGFTLAMRTWARLTAAAGRSKAYLYHFSHVPPHPRSKELGAYHTSEIPYVFDNLSQHDWVFQDADHRLADLVSSYWVNFATTGDPNGKGLPRWAPYDLTAEPYLDFGDSVALRHHLFKAQLDVLERFQQRH